MKYKRVDSDNGRFYTIDGIRMPSVTTILSIIDKPFLRFWYRKEALLAVEKNWKELANKMAMGQHIEDALKEITKQAKTKPDEIIQEALDIGSLVHKGLESIVKNAMFIKKRIIYWEQLGTGLTINDVGEGWEKFLNCINAFCKWARKVKFVPLESELTVYSKKLKYAGTLDATGLVNGKLAVIDFKSSKMFSPEMGLQLVAYKKAYEEMTEKKINEMWVLRLGKEDGAFSAHKIKNHKENFIAFKSAIKLWKWREYVKKMP